MWPNTLGRANYSSPYPDCRNGGFHRWGALHFMKQRNVTIRVCRLCDQERIVQYDIEEGKLTEIPLKTGNQNPKDTL
jgi:hypothetical protein